MTNIENTLIERMNAEHRACEVAAASAVRHAIRAGGMLQEVKESLPHGAFGPWLAANFEGGQRTAQTYMKLYRGRGALDAKTQRAAHLSIREALRELEPPKDEPGELAEDRLLWDHISLLVEDSPSTFLFRAEIPLVVKRLWDGTEGEADEKLLRDYRAASDLPEATTDFQHLNNIALTGWRIKRAIGEWVTTVVRESGDRLLLSQRLRHEASVAELEANPEAWEVFWHVTLGAPSRRTAGSEKGGR